MSARYLRIKRQIKDGINIFSINFNINIILLKAFHIARAYFTDIFYTNTSNHNDLDMIYALFQRS